MTTFGPMGRYGVVNLSELRDDRKNCVSEGNTHLAYTHIDEIIAFEIALTITPWRRSATTSTGRRQRSG